MRRVPIRALTEASGPITRPLAAHRGRILGTALAALPPTARVAPDPRSEGWGTEYAEDGNVLPPRPVPNVQRPAVEHNRPAAVTPVHPPMPRPRPADAPSPAVAVK